MPLFGQLSRRKFFALSLGAAFSLALPGVAKAIVPAPLARTYTRVIDRWEYLDVSATPHGQRFALSGHVKKENGQVLFSAARHHCDYCYLGHPSSVVRVSGLRDVEEGVKTLSGRIDMRSGKPRFICA